VLVVSRGHFSGITVVYRAAEGEPKDSRVESSPRLPRFDVRLRRCTVGQIKRQNSNSPTSPLFLFFPPPPWRCGPTQAMAYSFLRFLDHTQRRVTVGRTPLDE